MDFDYKIAVVEYDRTTRLLLQSSLGSHYALHVVESAEELLALPDRGGAQLFLLDVGLPGMDGLELCRALKSDPATAQAPVMFLSGHDTSEEILAGYEAGGQDYIVKPFDVASLRHKIENLQRIQAQQEILAEQVRNADELTTQVLASLDEYAVLIKFLRTLNECETPDDLIQESLGALQGFNLEGAVQIRMQGSEKKCSAYGENWPLEVAVINHIRTLDRIFEHKHLAAFNFDNITMLVTNMPRHEFELCGRIRDHLAIAMESANAKIRAMQSFMENSWMRGEIGQILQDIGRALQELAQKYQDARYQETIYTAHFIDEITSTFAEVGMSQQQEDVLLESVRSHIKTFVDLYDIAPHTQETLQVLTQRMEKILSSEKVE